MEERNAIALAILEILVNESDEDHILKRDDILNLLNQRYQIQIERRTLYSNIKLLQNFKYDISDFQNNGIGYYLLDRQFEKSEINLLCHSIYASHIIPDQASKQLIKKLLSTQNKYTIHEFNNHVYTKNYRKSENKEFFLNIEILLDAIQNNKKISFVYTQYNHKKERVAKRDKRYIMAPYDLIYANEKCYLLTYNEKYKGLTHFRVDKIKDIQMLSDSFLKLANFNAYEYASSKIYMYSGHKLSFLLRCDNTILDDVIDTFGSTIIIQKENDTSFVVKVCSSKEGIIYWALQYLKFCTILEPIEVKNEIIQILKNGLNSYTI